MPTFELLPRFRDDYGRLSESDKEAVWRAVRELIADLDSGRRIRHSLRPKRLRRHEGVGRSREATTDGRPSNTGSLFEQPKLT